MMALIEKGRSRFTDSAQSVMIPRERKRHCVTTFFCRLLRLSPAGRSSALPGEVATTNTFGYNVRSEVTSAAMGTNTYGYVFDPIGNRISATNNAEAALYAANALNQYTAISNAIPVLPIHDEDGNILTNGFWSYTWDGENRLIGVSSNDVLLVTYTYDHQFRRVGKGAGETTQSFLYDGWNLIQETSGTNSTHYVWGLDLSGSLQGAGGVGGLLAVLSPLPLGEGQGEGSTVYLPCYDANGNICEYSSTDGIIVAHYEYSPFGETVIQSGELADAFSFRFSTKNWEKEVGLYYYGYRFYKSEFGVWLSRDPLYIKNSTGCKVRQIRLVTGPNLYAFVENRPIFRYDVDGRGWFCDVYCNTPWANSALCFAVCGTPVGGPWIPDSCRLTNARQRIILDPDTECCLRKQCLYTYYCVGGHYSDELGKTCEYTLIREVGCEDPCTNANNNPSYVGCIFQ